MARRLGDMLVEEGLLTAEQLEEAVRLARQRNESLVRVLIAGGFVAEDRLLECLGREQGLPFIRLSETEISPAAVQAVSAKLASHYRVMPVAFQDGVLTLAVSTPYDMSAAEDIETHLGHQVRRVLACQEDIAAALRRHYGVGAETVERILADRPAGEAPAVEEQDLERMADEASVIRLVNQILHQGIRDRATDIHFEVYRDGLVARRRIDGVLYDLPVPRDIARLYPAMVSRIKMMAGLNIVERRLPQDGRARVTIGREPFDLRVSVVPTLHGENVVIRILPVAMLFHLEELGFSESLLAALNDLIRQPHGILFLTGPTGSGKSTTLYALLSRLNTRTRKIITIEDPVEYEIKGIMQTQINPRIDLTFARALRSMLRHDPDVMMVGEVRDRETADITIQTALTGHLVFSTLHTNDAASAAIRLADMGVDPYLIASTALAFMAQRLVRVLCARCRRTDTLEGRPVWRAQGCAHCNGTGYRGRQAIGEILRMSPAIQELVLRRATALDIRRRAVAEGMITLAQDGWDKVARGLTSAEEVLRVTSDAEDAAARPA